MKNTKKMLKNRYVSMVSRCKSKGHKSSYIYSDKGIKCEWETFEDFYRDMGPTFQEGLSIDRINGNGNYCKENCRWADRITQNNNRSNNIIIEDGLTLTQWSNKMGYRPLTVGAWYRDGFSIEKIKEKCRTFDWEKDRTHFETPELQKENYVTYQNWYYLNVTKKKRQERRNKKTRFVNSIELTRKVIALYFLYETHGIHNITRTRSKSSSRMKGALGN